MLLAVDVAVVVSLLITDCCLLLMSAAGTRTAVVVGVVGRRNCGVETGLLFEGTRMLGEGVVSLSVAAWGAVMVVGESSALNTFSSFLWRDVDPFCCNAGRVEESISSILDGNGVSAFDMDK